MSKLDVYNMKCWFRIKIRKIRYWFLPNDFYHNNSVEINRNGWGISPDTLRRFYED